MATRLDAAETLGHLIAFPSVSSTSNVEISDWVAQRLSELGFEIEQVPFEDAAGCAKNNIVARRDPQRPGHRAEGGLAYFCHTDVVPAAHWTGPGGDPFVAVARQQRWYGRGACDMKGSLAAMLAAVSEVLGSEQSAPLSIVCTADEEAGFGGARQVVKRSEVFRRLVEENPLSIIGEPTEMTVVHGHKGISVFEIISRGRAAHSSTADGINANEAMVPMLQTLLELAQRSRADPRYRQAAFDPPLLSWNFGIREGGTAANITPEQSIAWFSLRPMPEVDGSDLVETVQRKAQELGLEVRQLDGGKPVWTDPEDEAVKALCQLAGGSPATVCFGTDASEFSQLRRPVVWGPGSIEQAHTTNEWISAAQLKHGKQLYTAAIHRWCC